VEESLFSSSATSQAFPQIGPLLSSERRTIPPRRRRERAGVRGLPLHLRPAAESRRQPLPLLLFEFCPRFALLDPACRFRRLPRRGHESPHRHLLRRHRQDSIPQRCGNSPNAQADPGEHPSVLYFIEKQIILATSSAVDIMEEATEIALLAALLALVASAKPKTSLSPCRH